MRLVSIELQNYCQYKHAKYEFMPGVTLVVGKNGSGKSNMFKGIYAAITCDFARNDGVKTDNINQLATLDEKAYVRALIEHADTQIDITRNIRPASTNLVLQSGSTVAHITKSQEATDEILKTLGVSSRILSDYVFVDQWAIFNFLSMMPAERAKAFQRLFRTEKAEYLWKLVGSNYDAINIPTFGIDKDLVLKRHSDNKIKLNNFKAQLSNIVDIVKDEEIEKYRQKVEKYNRKEALLRKLQIIYKSIKTIQLQAEEDSVITSELENKKIELAARIAETHDSYIADKAILSSWEMYVGVDAQRNDIIVQVENIENKIKNLCLPSKPAEYVNMQDDEDFYNEYTALNNNVTANKHFMRLLTDDVVQCPTCGTPKKELATHRERYESELSTLEIKLAAAVNAIEISTVYDKAVAKYQVNTEQLNKVKESLVGQLATLNTINKPNKDIETLKTAIKSHDALIREHKEVDARWMDLSRQQSQYIGELKHLQKDKCLRETELSTIVVTTEEYELAKQKSTEYEKLKEDKAYIQANIKILEQMIVDDKSAIRQIKIVEHEAEISRKWADYCLKLRDILHRDNLPKIAALNYLELMQDEINSLLTRFDSPFHVITDDELSFDVIFKDGKKIPANRLSGGEKVLLAMSFRIAVNDIFARDLGLLVLDEPTAGLDEGNLGCLRIAIDKLKELSSARGLQVIIITHERDLHNIFDHVIEIGKD